MFKKTYRFYHDPGHGWLAVKRVELKRLGLLDKISEYSYQRGKTVYLEEDSDAGIFLREKTRRKEELDFAHTDYDIRCPIRSYDAYRPDITA